MFAIEAAKTRAYEQGFHDDRKIGIQKTKEKLADEVCQCENRRFKHEWIKALQAAEALHATGVDSASLLYQGHNFPFSALEVEKSDDEGGSE